MKNKLKCLFLDDLRDPKNAYVHIGTGHDHKKKSLIELSGIEEDDWSVTRNYESFSHYLKYVGIPNVVSFDHDLSEEHMKHYFTVTQQVGIVDYDNLKPDSGFHCAKLLCQKCLDTNTKFPKYYVHSANKWGGENIKNYIENFLKVYQHLQTHD